MSSSYRPDINGELVAKFLSEKGWISQQCSGCGNIFFLKTTSKPVHNCGWHRCDTKKYPFRSFSKRKKLARPAAICAHMTTFFRSVGFDHVEPLNVGEASGNTDLVIAGVQMFDGVIHHNQKPLTSKMFVAQPCIRMQFQPDVSSQEGTSTSFVNVCTEQMGATIEEHLDTVDHWCTALSKLGLHMNDFAIIMRQSRNNWGTGEFSALELFFTYGGLELGDAAYFNVPQQNRLAIPISDVGFGLERIAWAINKTGSYFDILVPWTSEGSKEMFDACRTIALLGVCGVQPGNKGPGLQLRRLAKVLGEKYYGADFSEILPYYVAYWTQFIKPSITIPETVASVRLEIERFVNLRICDEMELPPPRDEKTDEYLDRLVYTHNIDISAVRKALQQCKTKLHTGEYTCRGEEMKNNHFPSTSFFLMGSLKIAVFYTYPLRYEATLISLPPMCG